MNPELTYLCSFFQIMTSLIDNGCTVNIGKLQKKYNFDTLSTLAEQSKSCYPLKRNIRALLNRLFYFEPGLDAYLKAIISR